jgi:hypothetical protein
LLRERETAHASADDEHVRGRHVACCAL